jgi:Tol biopolymer transport system component
LSEPFGEPVNLGPTVNSEFFESGATLSADGRMLLFASTRPGGQGGLDIWTCTRPSPDEPFGEAVNLGPPVNSIYWETGPALSTDGLTLVFGSKRPNGYGHADLWMSTRASSSEPFGEPVNLGPAVNTGVDDGRPALSADGLTLVFASNRPGSQGKSDIWACTRASSSDSFGEPFNLGPTVNSSAGEFDPALSADGLALLFQTYRFSEEGNPDTWMARIEHRDVPSTEEVPGTIADVPFEPAPTRTDATQLDE